MIRPSAATACASLVGRSLTCKGRMTEPAWTTPSLRDPASQSMPSQWRTMGRGPTRWRAKLSYFAPAVMHGQSSAAGSLRSSAGSSRSSQAHRVCISPPAAQRAACPSPKPRRASERWLRRRPPLRAGELGTTSGGGVGATGWWPARRPTGRARRGGGRLRARPGKACARRAAWGGWGRPQAWAPAGAGWQGVGGRGRVGLRQKWLYFSSLHPRRR